MRRYTLHGCRFTVVLEFCIRMSNKSLFRFGANKLRVILNIASTGIPIGQYGNFKIQYQSQTILQYPKRVRKPYPIQIETSRPRLITKLNILLRNGVGGSVHLAVWIANTSRSKNVFVGPLAIVGLLHQVSNLDVV